MLAALAGCATAAGPYPTRAGADCVALFQQFDVIEASMSTPFGQADRMTIPPVLQLPAQRLRNAGCITLSDDLAGLSSPPGPPIADGGPRIAPPISLHAGAVTNMADDGNALAFFEANGVPARSVGSSALGRRIYLGPFATQGALDGARELALRAGFAYPYPARF
jgi:hypothetical protein